MRLRIIRRGFALVAVALVLSLSPASLSAQEKTKKQKVIPRGTPVLWSAPEDIASRDLFYGPGGAAMKPDMRSITFIKKETGGTSEKYRVRDASGREWVAKVGKEAQSETAAVRLVWAAGYVTEINYLWPRVNIRGKGTYDNVRFEARSKSVKRLDEWLWADNPFGGTNELQGLKVLMVMINNWDLKDENNKIFHVRGEGGRDELRYVISDLGATFGKTGSLPLLWRVTRSRNEPGDYVKTNFVEGVEGRYVKFNYGGKNKGMLENISVEQARWIGDILARLSDKQIGDAFRAANYTSDEVAMLTRAVRSRIDELNALRAEGSR